MPDVFKFPIVSLVALLALLCAGRPALAGAEIVYDFVKHYPSAKISGAMTSGAEKSTSGGVERNSIFLHPSNKPAVATYRVSLPKVKGDERIVFSFSAGLREKIPTDDKAHPFDGVKLILRIDGKELFSQETEDSKWFDGVGDLTAMAGKQITVELVTDPKTNCNYDWAAWGEPRIFRLSDGLLTQGGIQAPVVKGIAVADYIGRNEVSIRPNTPDAVGHAVEWSSSDPVGTSRIAVIPFDFTGSGATGVELHLTHLIGRVQVYAYAPSLRIVSFSPTHELMLADEPAEFRCVVENDGEGSLNTSAGARVYIGGINALPQTLGDMAPGSTKTLSWQDIRLPAGPASAHVALSGAGISTRTASWQGEIANASASIDDSVTSTGAIVLPGKSVVLQNPALRMVFLRGKDCYAGWIAYAPEDTLWTPVASGRMGKVVLPSGTGSPVAYEIKPNAVRIEGRSVTFTNTSRLKGVAVRTDCTFTIDSTRPRVSIKHAMNSSADLDLLHFSGPTVYAGDLGFGTGKDEALFPGLEYLLGESSSGTENAAPPYNLRTVPHPNKVTIPLMAVRSGSTLVTLEWNPLQKWDGKADRPSAVFASPNFLDGTDNHKMGIFAPSVPGWVEENVEIAAKPYKLKANSPITLSADLFVSQGCRSVLDATTDWIVRHGLPKPPKPKTPTKDLLAFCNEAYFGPTWDDNAKAWKHTNTGPVFFDPIIGVCMWTHADFTPNPAEKKRLMDYVNPAVDRARGSLNVDVALRSGDVIPALDRLAAHVDGKIASQLPNGSWPFTPDKEHEIFGRPGDSSSGHTTVAVREVLQYALMTGDPKARESALRALAYLDKQPRPEGSQTWELQLHVPDILASAWLIESSLYGYQLTGERKHLDRALYWAKSGLPFVYLWNANDRPIMRYGTIPVFGVTYFSSMPWFGKIVQWCGLEYAYWLSRLSEYDSSMPWKTISDGILNCAVQQQEYITKAYPTDVAMYPDAYSPITGAEAYHWDLNPRFVSKTAMRNMGQDGFAKTAVIHGEDGHPIAFTAPAQTVKLHMDGETLRAQVTGTPEATLYMLLSGVTGPTSISIQGRSLTPCENLDEVEEGMMLIPSRNLTVLKVKSSGDMALSIAGVAPAGR